MRNSPSYSTSCGGGDSSAGTRDKLQVIVNTPGGNVHFPVPILKMQQFSLNDLFEKKLFFLLPFYIFTKEKNFREYERNPEKLEELKKVYEDILYRIDQLVKDGQMTAYEQLTLIDMMKRVLNGIARKYYKVRKGVNDTMGGVVLDHLAKRMYNEGIEQERINNVRIIMQKMKMTAQQAMDFLDIPVSEQSRYNNLLD